MLGRGAGFGWVRVTECMVRVPEIGNVSTTTITPIKKVYEYSLPIAFCPILCVDKIFDSCYLVISISRQFGSEFSAAHPIYVNPYIWPELVCNPTTDLSSVKMGQKCLSCRG